VHAIYRVADVWIEIHKFTSRGFRATDGSWFKL